MSGWGLTIIALLLLLFGNRLPSVMRSLGRGITAIKKSLQAGGVIHHPFRGERNVPSARFDDRISGVGIGENTKGELNHAMPLPGSVVVEQERDSESITQSHIDKLAAYVQQLRDSVGLCEGQRARQKSIESHLTCFSVRTRLCIRKCVDNVLGWRWAGILITALAVGAIFFIATLSWKLAVAGIVIGGAVSLFMLYFPTDSDVAMEQDELVSLQAVNLANAEVLIRHKANLAVASEKLRKWNALLTEKQYRESRQYRRQQLAQKNWKAMRGGELEQFLAEVFSELEYTVDRTGKAGDQGVDLIVSKNGHRIAVQVKGYVDSVPNTAIQEADTGMRYHDCDACAVITNSRFTSGGKNVAAKVGCVLIDENTLPKLIMGQIDLLQEILAARA